MRFFQSYPCMIITNMLYLHRKQMLFEMKTTEFLNVYPKLI